MITSLPFVQRFEAVFGYIISAEASDLAQSAAENEWTIEQCLNDHVLGHMIVMACDLGVLKGAPDEQLWEAIQEHTDYYPPVSEPSEDDEIMSLVRKFGSWGQDERHPRSDWQAEVGNGETNLGYWDWLLQQYDIHDEEEGE